MDFNRIIAGMIRAARLDVAFYEEVEHDTSYSQDALYVVVIAAIAAAIGSFLSGLIARSFVYAFVMLIYTAVITVAIYYLWVFLVQWIGTSFFKGKGDFGEVQRALGFAYAPHVLRILGFIPILGGLIGFVAWIWSVATGFVAIRQSMDLDNTNAALTVIISAVAVFIVQLIIGAILGAILLAIGLAGAAVTGAL
jgi:hypothetical protein